MRKKIGSNYLQDGQCEFTVWAPELESVAVKLVSKNEQLIELKKQERGYWSTIVKDIRPGDLYFFQLDKKEQWPDPASQYQPQDVHGPSAIVDHSSFKWSDDQWKGMALKDMIIYELHVGTFTKEGTFESLKTRIPYLKELGITAIEIMPVNQFPGNRNWGYDGVYPFAIQHSYGGPDGFKDLVNACHNADLAVIVDAVYNHFGPEGNYTLKYGPYFTPKYQIPWGNAINFDCECSDEVRNYFIENALMWFRDYHVDALRLDAVHAYKDLSAHHFMRQLAEEVKALEKETGRQHVLIGEVDLNDPKYITPLEQGGFGLDGQWCDEFHHAIHSLVTGEVNGYYEDFGKLEHIRRAYQDSYVYTGQYSEHRKRTFGAYPTNNPYSQFVVFAQNHDQVGNRLMGERMSVLLPYDSLKLIAGATLVSPSIPLLFMGEEFGEEAPFQYFTSHTDPELIKGIREGRKKEFEYFHFEGEAPDPQSEDTFQKSKLHWDYAKDQKKNALWQFYQKLIELRKIHSAFKNFDRNTVKVQTDENNSLLKLERQLFSKENEGLYVAMNFGKKDTAFSLNVDGNWKLYLDSSDTVWEGPGKSAPDNAKTGDTITIKSQSIIIYIKQ